MVERYSLIATQEGSERHVESTSMSTRSQLIRLGAFIVIELLWIAVVIMAHFLVVEAPSSAQPATFGGFKITQTGLFESGISTVSILWQLFALLPIIDIIKVTFASEWMYLLSCAKDTVSSRSNVDRVSTLAFGFSDQLRYVFTKESSLRYRLAFTVLLMTFALQALAPGSIIFITTTITSSSDKQIEIGTLMQNRTALMTWTDSELLQNDDRVILRGSLLDSAVRFVSVASSERSRVGYVSDIRLCYLFHL